MGSSGQNFSEKFKMTKKSEIIKLLKRRAECLDRDGRYSEALPCYQEGLETSKLSEHQKRKRIGTLGAKD